MSRTSIHRLSISFNENQNVKKYDNGEFTFLNGDAYVGGYMIIKDKKLITRQGRGIYVTEDFDKYETHWVEDQIVGEVDIRHNNGTEYKGTLDTDGEMFGSGVYTFTDNSVIKATWEHNKPVADINLKDPFGCIWKGVCDGKEVVFTVGNHFWDELISPSSDDEEEEEAEE